MQKFVYIIGSTDDFESLEELVAWYHRGDDGVSYRNWSAYTVELREDTQVVGYNTLAEVARVIAMGEAMNDSWCLDDTVSVIIPV